MKSYTLFLISHMIFPVYMYIHSFINLESLAMQRVDKQVFADI